MKSVLTIAAALSALTAASAYAMPKAAPVVPAAAITATAPAKVAQASSTEKPVLVAENRREFGSSYQRY